MTQNRPSLAQRQSSPLLVCTCKPCPAESSYKKRKPSSIHVLLARHDNSLFATAPPTDLDDLRNEKLSADLLAENIRRFNASEDMNWAIEGKQFGEANRANRANRNADMKWLEDIIGHKEVIQQAFVAVTVVIFTGVLIAFVFMV